MPEGFSTATDAEPITGLGVDPTGLRQFLAHRDVPCPLCGYNLRGLTTDLCPECGRELRLGVSLAEPFLKAWVALLVALLLPAGFGVILILGIGYAIAHQGLASLTGDVQSAPFVPLLIGLYVAGSVPLAVGTLALRRSFLRLPRAVQSAAAAVGWAALIGIVFYLLSRLF